ncbi:hypothetical protein ElyMa_004575400 [Elysia marginata]|uniref:Uncharacterized protein n=1 Tax=Elysia marginata TaxID=1093978 RepID=A0AAV4HXH5_9GAST|nr:hypothetical protein ElyMa_004575400 [Elysia marginata]
MTDKDNETTRKTRCDKNERRRQSERKRLESGIPANEAMQFYFVENNRRPRGRPITALSVTLNNDLKHVQSEKMTLTSQKDLDLIRDIAENRDEWRTFIAELSRGAAEAARSDDPTSERL